MKNLAIGLLSVVALISLTQCNQSATSKVADPGERGKIISVLVNNKTWMAEVMDSMQVKHGAGMGKHDMAMNPEMMDKMMEMCKTDTSACKMMMDKTAMMCEADQSKRDMMMGSMGSSPKMMQSMHEMCDMKDKKE